MARSERQTILKVSNLNVQAMSDIILRDIEFAIVEGETLGVVGASGSGKTLSILSALGLTNDDLEVSSDGVQYRGKAADNIRFPKDVAVVYQNARMALNPLKKCGKQVDRILSKHLKFSKVQAKARTLELFEKVDLDDAVRIYDSYPHQVSGGELQRVMIAMGLSCAPDLLVLDEPTSSLDKVIQSTIVELLKKLKKEDGLALLIISHDLEVIAELADRIIHIDGGIKISDQVTSDFFVSPMHDKSASLISLFKHFRQNKFKDASASSEVVGLESARRVFPNGKTAFSEVNLKIYKNEKLGIIGESGSGKSTLSKCIAGIDELSTGSLMRSIDKEKIAYVFQDAYSALDPELNVGQILHEVVRLQKNPLDLPQLMDQVLLDKTNLKKKIHQLSGGQRQRVNLARAIASEPDLIICDEITSGLDANVQFEIIDLLERKMNKLTIIFVSHDISLVKNFCERVAIMREGKIIEVGTTREVFTNPDQKYTSQLINSVPKVKYFLNM